MRDKNMIYPDFTRDVIESDIPRDVLEILLKDRTTGKNIIWMSDGYARFESDFGAKMGLRDEMTADVVARPGTKVIRPRVDKSKTEQKERVQKKAEVFTPSWICNKQNNIVDAAWFGRETRLFNREKPDVKTGLAWTATASRVKFSKGRSWQEYVATPRLEISCGEAPYLTSRYDPVNPNPDGSVIPVPLRIGFLDRKLRIVSERIQSQADWLVWAQVALQSVYGFDWQGDNVLLARENLLFSVLEAYAAKFPSSAVPKADLLAFAEIVSWNIWQMDGIKLVVPMSCHDEVDLLGGETPCPACGGKHSSRHNGIYCKIMDWRTNSPVEFASLAGKGGFLNGR